MGRDPDLNQTPDLFPTGAGRNKPSEGVPARPLRRPALPKDLPKAISYLADAELDWLVRTALQEAKRRGRPVPRAEARPSHPPTGSPEATPKQVRPMGKPNRQRHPELASTTVT